MWRWFWRIALGVLAVLVFETVLAALVGGLPVVWLIAEWIVLMTAIGVVLLFVSAGRRMITRI